MKPIVAHLWWGVVASCEGGDAANRTERRCHRTHPDSGSRKLFLHGGLCQSGEVGVYKSSAFLMTVCIIFWWVRALAL